MEQLLGRGPRLCRRGERAVAGTSRNCGPFDDRIQTLTGIHDRSPREGLSVPVSGDLSKDGPTQSAGGAAPRPLRAALWESRCPLDSAELEPMRSGAVMYEQRRRASRNEVVIRREVVRAERLLLRRRFGVKNEFQRLARVEAALHCDCGSNRCRIPKP